MPGPILLLRPRWRSVAGGHRVRRPSTQSEGMDLTNLSLPDNQDALIEAVAAANPHTIVVLETGGAVLMPWIDKVARCWRRGIREFAERRQSPTFCLAT